MKTRSHKQKVRKTKRQKKVRSLQIENEELRTKLSQYEVEIAAQAEQFHRYKEEYQQKIDRLKAKIRLQRKEDIPILEKQIINWREPRKVCVKENKRRPFSQESEQETNLIEHLFRISSRDSENHIHDQYH